MFVIGNSVRGGKVYGDWPGLKRDQLYEGRDLALTTDFRDVFGELAAEASRQREPASKSSPATLRAPSKFRSVLGDKLENADEHG